ncbi:tryptophan dimethylallyltransferase family protein [Kitasatospora sp. NPDC058032]|uniref:tryptophan dimethylallyltransferase family protein n=1 Tax=Kitasatospora sp. NPDC058032 TaxID=3346307 RepID=UPI0036DABA9A
MELLPELAGEVTGDPERRGVATLGEFTSGQLQRLCAVAGLGPEDARTYADVLTGELGPEAGRRLDLPPSGRTFLSDDHTPVEYSLAFRPDGPPDLRVLLEPGCGAGTLEENGRAGLAAVHAMSRRWGFGTACLDKLEELLLPPSPQGPLALWCALELRPGGVPRVKVYLNPAARGASRAGATVREALERIGHHWAFEGLPEGDGYPFLALDLGDWELPRVKVYVRHSGLSAAEVGELSRMPDGPPAAELREFAAAAAGTGRADARFSGLPVLSCHSFTDPADDLPSGFTLHVPVRDYVRHDGEALDRAVDLLSRNGMDPDPLLRALPALTGRRPRDGVGMIAYLALAHQRGRPPRITAYLSAEAYAVRPPTG